LEEGSPNQFFTMNFVPTATPKGSTHSSLRPTFRLAPFCLAWLLLPPFGLFWLLFASFAFFDPYGTIWQNLMQFNATWCNLTQPDTKLQCRTYSTSENITSQGFIQNFKQISPVIIKRLCFKFYYNDLLIWIIWMYFYHNNKLVQTKKL
jgi:hypothetical protein